MRYERAAAKREKITEKYKSTWITEIYLINFLHWGEHLSAISAVTKGNRNFMSGYHRDKKREIAVLIKLLTLHVSYFISEHSLFFWQGNMFICKNPKRSYI